MKHITIEAKQAYTSNSGIKLEKNLWVLNDTSIYFAKITKFDSFEIYRIELKNLDHGAPMKVFSGDGRITKIKFRNGNIAILCEHSRKDFKSSLYFCETKNNFNSYRRDSLPLYVEDFWLIKNKIYIEGYLHGFHQIFVSDEDSSNWINQTIGRENYLLTDIIDANNSELTILEFKDYTGNNIQLSKNDGFSTTIIRDNFNTNSVYLEGADVKYILDKNSNSFIIIEQLDSNYLTLDKIKLKEVNGELDDAWILETDIILMIVKKEDDYLIQVIDLKKMNLLLFKNYNGVEFLNYDSKKLLFYNHNGSFFTLQLPID